MPARSADEEVPSLSAGSARANIGKVIASGVDKFHAVVSTAHVRYTQDIRLPAEVEYTNGVESIAVRALLQQGGRGIGRRKVRLCIERVDRDGSPSQAFLDYRLRRQVKEVGCGEVVDVDEGDYSHCQEYCH